MDEFLDKKLALLGLLKAHTLNLKNFDFDLWRSTTRKSRFSLCYFVYFVVKTSPLSTPLFLSIFFAAAVPLPARHP